MGWTDAFLRSHAGRPAGARHRRELVPSGRLSYDERMRLATGKVRKGAIVLDGTPFEEGETVTVIARDRPDTFEVGPQDEALLLNALEEADRGECLDASEVLATIERPK